MKSRLTLGYKYLVVLRIGMITVLMLFAMALVCFIKARFPSDLYFFGEHLALTAEKLAVITAIVSFLGDAIDKTVKSQKG